jgi:nucleotide-binding universal stress UspA family protein
VCGQSIYTYARRLLLQGITGDICQRQGEPNLQIQQEVREGNYDLVVIGAEPYSRLERWIFGELVGPMLHWIDRPVLVAKRLQSQRESS